MSERDLELPPLSHRMRRALQEAKGIKPSRALENRVFQAIAEAESSREARKKGRMGARSIPVALVLVGGAAVASVGAGAVCWPSVATRLSHEGATFHDLAVQLPEIGHVIVELPVDASRHDAERVMVSFEAPKSVALHLDEAQAPDEYRKECGSHRCVHRWGIDRGSDERATPRVRINEPGLYEFSVTYASEEHSHRANFAVLATR